jgi:hypothetical protein
MARASLPGTVTQFSQITTSIVANAADFPHVQTEVQELQELVPEILELNAAQAALFAQSQQATKDLQEKLDRGLVLFAQLRAAVRAKYSTRSEKLTEFHLRPLGRRRGTAAPKVKKEEEIPPAPAPTSTPTTP